MVHVVGEVLLDLVEVQVVSIGIHQSILDKQGSPDVAYQSVCTWLIIFMWYVEGASSSATKSKYHWDIRRSRRSGVFMVHVKAIVRVHDQYASHCKA